MTYYSIRTYHGFTLVEMAIVLFIVALLLGGLLPTVTSQLEQQRNSETSKQLAEIKEALIGYALVNGRLPRPATSATNGSEHAACATAADCTGFIPWATLGTPKLDSWGKIIRYSVTPAFAGGATGTDLFTLSATVATKTIQTDSVTSIYLAGQGSCTTTNQCVPAVILSHGRNNFGTSDSGIAQTNNSATNLDETKNSVNTDNFFSRIRSSNTTEDGGEFDDLVVWVPLNTLMSRMVAAGQLP